MMNFKKFKKLKLGTRIVFCFKSEIKRGTIASTPLNGFYAIALGSNGKGRPYSSIVFENQKDFEKYKSCEIYTLFDPKSIFSSPSDLFISGLLFMLNVVMWYAYYIYLTNNLL